MELIVTGTHLDPGYGFTVQEIEADGLRIDERIPIPVASGSAVDISNNQAETLKQFALLFEKKQYDADGKCKAHSHRGAAQYSLTPLLLTGWQGA